MSNPVLTWTRADEDDFQRMAARREAALSERRAAVRAVAEKMLCYDMSAAELEDAPVSHADELVAALKPFCE